MQRNRISRLINPRAAKRLASRQDITEFVRGCVEHAAGAVHIGTPTTESIRAEARPPDEQLLIDSLRREGKCDSYIRGALQVHRDLRGR